MERFANMYRFAEFGRLSSGLFHNLANLLTGSTLNMDRLMESPAWDVGGMKANIKSALRAHNKMRRFIETTHRQLAGEQEMSTFSALSEVSEIIQLVSHRARSAAVSIVIEAEEDVSLYGSPVIFNQIVISLITNAIDAYFDVPTTARDNRKVIVCIRDLGSHVSLEVVDKGCGVPEDIREKIFEPFFTTKSDSRGVGIGLALTKRMVERDFGGTISVTCNKENGTVFTIIFPKKQADAASLA